MKKMLFTLMIVIALVGLVGCAQEAGNAEQTGNEEPDAQEPDVQDDSKGANDGQDYIEGQGVYLNYSGLIVMESYPVQVRLSLSGDLATPCHGLKVEFPESADEFEILVSVYAVQDTDEECIQVLEPFDESITIPTQGLPDGSYKVILNGEEIGTFNYPG